MKKTALILTGDYWHPTASIIPLLDLMLPQADWKARATENPAELLNTTNAPDLFVTFKDPIENAQISTSIWCDSKWSNALKKLISEEGMGFLAIHCGLADLPAKHIISCEILRARFVSHPPQCEVKFIPEKAHPITNHLSEFTFPADDEHYIMEMLPEFPTGILGYTISENGRQPALWAHSLGKGRICGVTPGHVTENLIFPEYVKLLKNAADWCVYKK
ncbi:MAG: ThuA domain-containing protein [Clostridium sp.]|nr:ThuA domain-containing protein [Clostridium sp.]